MNGLRITDITDNGLVGQEPTQDHADDADDDTPDEGVEETRQ